MTYDPNQTGSKGTARLRGSDGGSTIERRAARAHRTLCGSGSYRQSIASSATRAASTFGSGKADAFAAAEVGWRAMHDESERQSSGPTEAAADE